MCGQYIFTSQYQYSRLSMRGEWRNHPRMQIVITCMHVLLITPPWDSSSVPLHLMGDTSLMSFCVNNAALWLTGRSTYFDRLLVGCLFYWVEGDTLRPLPLQHILNVITNLASCSLRHVCCSNYIFTN